MDCSTLPGVTEVGLNDRPRGDRVRPVLLSQRDRPLGADLPLPDDATLPRLAMIALLTLVFVLSGAAGLMYESVWSRYLGLFVGHSAYAQIIVLVIFLGGMAIGALHVGRRSEKMREPLIWYAGVEIAVGLIGLLFHDVFTSVTGFAYDTIFPALPGAAAVIVAKWLIAALLILPQSILL